MPSSRRVKTVATFAAVFFLAFLYFSGSASKSDKAFYERSVAGMAARAKGAVPGADIKPSPQIPSPAPDAKESAHVKVNQFAPDYIGEGRKPAQVAMGEGDDPKFVKAPGDRAGTEKEKPAAKVEKTEEELDVEAELNSILKRSPIIIFSKTYCPHSKKAKVIFGLYSITPAPFIVELDQHKLGPPLQDQLKKFTGRRTVPNVLISGTSIGGGDEVNALHQKGELVNKVKEMGGKRIMEARLKGVKERD